MNLDMLKERKQLVSTTLLVVALLSVALMLAKFAGFFMASARAETAVRDAIKHSQPDAKNVATQLEKSKKVADALKKKNLFSPPAPRKNPITAVAAIMGDEALINGKWYKAGAKVGDAKILAVNATSVETEWDGKKTTFSPIDGDKSSGPSGPSRPGRPSPRRGPGPPRGGRPGMVVTEGARPGQGGSGGGMPDWRSITREKMMSMSEAERSKFRAQMREKVERMSEAEREKFRAHMREQFGGRPGGGDGRARGARPGGRQPMRLNAR